MFYVRLWNIFVASSHKYRKWHTMKNIIFGEIEPDPLHQLNPRSITWYKYKHTQSSSGIKTVLVSASLKNSDPIVLQIDLLQQFFSFFCAGLAPCLSRMLRLMFCVNCGGEFVREAELLVY